MLVKKLVPNFLKRNVKNFFNSLDYFYRLKKTTHGMLDAKVYKELYRFSKANGTNILEIGSGSGTSTIALAKGLSINSRIFSIEKFEGGSRSELGSKEDNMNLFKNNLKTYGVEKQVSLFPQAVDNNLASSIIKESGSFGLLFLDADGEIWRDFEFFFNALNKGGYIIIDDYSPEKKPKPVSERYPLGGLKQYRTYCYTNFFIENGYLEPIKTIGDTFFGKKPNRDLKFNKMEEEKLAEFREHFNQLRSQIAES